jgi:hypothetical protein
MRWIHYDCLKHWIHSKLQVKSSDALVEVNSKAVRCELCQEYFPPSFESSSGETFSLFDLGVNFTRYAMVEDRDGPLYILNYSQKDFLTVGRGHNCDFKIGEITVSRQHVEMRLENGFITLKD